MDPEAELEAAARLIMVDVERIVSKWHEHKITHQDAVEAIADILVIGVDVLAGIEIAHGKLIDKCPEH